MSSALAIAGVTQILRDLLNNALIDADVSGALGGNVNVRARAPDRAEDVAADGESFLNLFLWRVSPNSAWANHVLPTRNAAGARLANTPLALDLHYLVSAHGADDLHAEILLGHAMQLLHEHPMLGRAEIRTALDSLPDLGGDLPPALQSLGRTGLADQYEQIRISPAPLGLDELSKLWTACSASLRTAAAYQVSVVLIEATRPGRRALPVLALGPDNSGAIVSLGVAPPFPTITGIQLPDGQPSARPGDVITLSGQHLAGTSVSARFTSSRVADPIAVPVPIADVSVAAVAVTIPDVPGDWVAGPWQVGLVVETGAGIRTSNGIGLAVAPIMILPPTSVVRASDDSVTVTLDARPRTRPGQVATLAIGTSEVVANPILVPTDTLVFRFPSLAGGVAPARLRVDGVDSWLVNQTQRPPTWFPDQAIAVPA